MIGTDTNVLLRYVVRNDENAYRHASAFMNGLTPQNPGFITQVTMAEFHCILSRTYRFDRETRLSVIRGPITSARP